MSHCVTDEAPNFADPFFVIETACTAWFTLDKTQCCRRRVVVLVLQLRCCVHLRSFTIPSFNGSRSFFLQVCKCDGSGCCCLFAVKISSLYQL